MDDIIWNIRETNVFLMSYAAQTMLHDGVKWNDLLKNAFEQGKLVHYRISSHSVISYRMNYFI